MYFCDHLYCQHKVGCKLGLAFLQRDSPSRIFLILFASTSMITWSLHKEFTPSDISHHAIHSFIHMEFWKLNYFESLNRGYLVTYPFKGQLRHFTLLNSVPFLPSDWSIKAKVSPYAGNTSCNYVCTQLAPLSTCNGTLQSTDQLQRFTQRFPFSAYVSKTLSIEGWLEKKKTVKNFL